MPAHPSSPREMVTASAADREPPNPSGLARITLVAQILLLSPMQSSLHLHNRLKFVAPTRPENCTWYEQRHDPKGQVMSVDMHSRLALFDVMQVPSPPTRAPEPKVEGVLPTHRSSTPTSAATVSTMVIRRALLEDMEWR